MRSILAFATLLALAVANPLSLEERELVKRATCANGATASPSPTGAGPLPTPNDLAHWMTYAGFASAASAAAAPSGYKRAFHNLNGSVVDADYEWASPGGGESAYNATSCAQKCNDWTGCKAFNIYFERDPINTCPNPAATTIIKCVLYGSPIGTDEATNTGQWNQEFEILVAGSNGYNKR